MNNTKRRNPRRPQRIKLFEKSMDSKMGLPPGTPVHIGNHKDFKPFATLTSYCSENYKVNDNVEPREIRGLIPPGKVTWLNIEGIHDIALIQEIGEIFDLHPLSIEDIVNTASRPQFETFNGYFFFSLKMLYLNAEKNIVNEHISLVLKDSVLISFQETPGDVFGKIRDRLRAQTSKVRSRGADYLLYAIIDSIVDGYYQVVDHLGEKIDQLEEELRSGPHDKTLSKVFEIRRDVLFLRKNIVPVRDLLNKVQVDGSVFQENTKIYLKDLSDHIVQVTESLALEMDMSNVLIETYHSMQNQRMNAIMKTLTMISTIFLPLNFIAGVYGMNFHHMPELEWQYGYEMALGAMAVVVVCMLIFFVYRGWILSDRKIRFPFFEHDETPSKY